ncbi:MAG: hypothetical protein INR65_06685 [Gluconacetobacter diazotrophicus]|nr:hypothetical protein [Gluconacetobacter diazotrophicus]
MSGPVCLFAHHDPDGRIAPHVVHLLRGIRESGFAIHVALSGQDHVRRSDAEAVRDTVAAIHPRPNAGLDFGAWRDLFARGCADGASEVLLANDSVYGPLFPLPPIVAAMRARNADAWGMVESEQNGWHLQSWFVCLSARALAAVPVRRVLEQDFAGMSKREVVLHGELGLGAAMEAAQLRVAARWRQPNRRLRRMVPGNAMHLDYMAVVRSGRVPFLKVELLRDNPTAVHWVGRWRELVPPGSAFDPAWIDAHLSAGRPHRPPRPPRGFAARLLQALISEDRPVALRTLRRH